MQRSELTANATLIRGGAGAQDPGTTGRKFTTITGVTEENSERERFRRAHYYPVSEALLQGHSHPPRTGEYHSARELRSDMTKHTRPKLPVHAKFGYTTRPPVANMEYVRARLLPRKPSLPPCTRRLCKISSVQDFQLSSLGGCAGLACAATDQRG